MKKNEVARRFTEKIAKSSLASDSASPNPNPVIPIAFSINIKLLTKWARDNWTFLAKVSKICNFKGTISKKVLDIFPIFGVRLPNPTPYFPASPAKIKNFLE